MEEFKTTPSSLPLLALGTGFCPAIKFRTSTLRLDRSPFPSTRLMFRSASSDRAAARSPGNRRQERAVTSKASIALD